MTKEIRRKMQETVDKIRAEEKAIVGKYGDETTASEKLEKMAHRALCGDDAIHIGEFRRDYKDCHRAIVAALVSAESDGFGEGTADERDYSTTMNAKLCEALREIDRLREMLRVEQTCRTIDAGELGKLRDACRNLCPGCAERLTALADLTTLNKLEPGSAPPGTCASPADPGSSVDGIYAALSGVREALDEIATDSVKTRQDIEGKPTTTHYSIGHSDACEHFWRKAREARDELDRLVEEVAHAAPLGNAGASPDPATHSADQGSDPAVSSDAAGSGVGGYELSPIPTRDLAVMLCQLMFPKDLDFASAIRDEIIRRGNAR